MRVTNLFNQLSTVQMSGGIAVPHKLNANDVHRLLRAAEQDNDNGCCTASDDKGYMELKKLVDGNPDKFDLTAKCLAASRLIGFGIRLRCDNNEDQSAKK